MGARLGRRGFAAPTSAAAANPSSSLRRFARGAAWTGTAVVTLCVVRAGSLSAAEGLAGGSSSGPLALASAPQASSLLGRSEGEGSLARRGLLQRAAWLLWSFSWVLFLSPVAMLSSGFREQVYYRLLYEAIVYSRSAALAKWSQWASIRYDLLPATLCLLLSRLQSDAPTHPFAHTLAELEATGIRLPVQTKSRGGGEQLVTPGASAMSLSLLEEAPIASGSIAQVHSAICGGERVVVKVRHPRVGEELLLDMEILRRAATALHKWVPSMRWLNAPSTVAQFEAAMSGQCDLSQEALHLEAFRFNFRRKAAWMVIPKVLFASPAVLVESYEAGELATDFVRRGLEVDRSDAHFIIARGEDIYLQMLLVDNFMHADLHPGNLIFRRAGLLGRPQLAVLDGGMAAHLTAEERRNFIGLLQAMGDGDGSAAAERVLGFSRKRSSNAEAFVSDVSTMCTEKCKGYGTGLNMGVVIREMMQLMYRHSVPIDGNYATLIANMLCLEGMARELEPRFNVLDVAYPLLRGHQLFGDDLFQRAFKLAQWVVPLPVWEQVYRFALYSALNGESLKRFQI